MGAKQRRISAWAGKAIAALGAAWLLWNGGKDFLLLAAGTQKQAVVEYSVSSWGARNRVYETHYWFQAEGREWRGSGSATRRLPAGAEVRIRYLSWAPAVNAAGSPGVLIFWGGLQSAGGVLALLLLRC